MTYVIHKAKVGYIVRPEQYMRDGYSSVINDWAAFDTWEQAAEWVGKQFKEQP